MTRFTDLSVALNAVAVASRDLLPEALTSFSVLS